MSEITMGRVINSRATFLTLPAIKTGAEVVHPAVRLGPGATNLPDQYLEALSKLPPRGAGKVWADWVRLGWVKVIRAAAPEAKAELAKPEGPPPPPGLGDIREEAALALVAVEDNPATLRTWYSAEKRKPVKQAITARLAVLGAKLEG